MARIDYLLDFFILWLQFITIYSIFTFINLSKFLYHFAFYKLYICLILLISCSLNKNQNIYI